MPDKFNSFLSCKLFVTELFLCIIVSSESLSIKLTSLGGQGYMILLRDNKGCHKKKQVLLGLKTEKKLLYFDILLYEKPFNFSKIL